MLYKIVAILARGINMKNFLSWAEEHNLDLNTNVGNTLQEKRVRTGIKFGYPDAYVNAQYPDLYKPPYSATAPFDLMTRKQQRDVAGKPSGGNF